MNVPWAYYTNCHLTEPQANLRLFHLYFTATSDP